MSRENSFSYDSDYSPVKKSSLEQSDDLNTIDLDLEDEKPHNEKPKSQKTSIRKEKNEKELSVIFAELTDRLEKLKVERESISKDIVLNKKSNSNNIKGKDEEDTIRKKKEFAKNKIDKDVELNKKLEKIEKKISKTQWELDNTQKKIDKEKSEEKILNLKIKLSKKRNEADEKVRKIKEMHEKQEEEKEKELIEKEEKYNRKWSEINEIREKKNQQGKKKLADEEIANIQAKENKIKFEMSNKAKNVKIYKALTENSLGIKYILYYIYRGSVEDAVPDISMPYPILDNLDKPIDADWKQIPWIKHDEDNIQSRSQDEVKRLVYATFHIMQCNR